MLYCKQNQSFSNKLFSLFETLQVGLSSLEDNHIFLQFQTNLKSLKESSEQILNLETMIQVVHGIGEGKLKRLTEEFVANSDFLKLYNTESWIIPNPGVTKIEVLGPSKEDLKKYLQWYEK